MDLRQRVFNDLCIVEHNYSAPILEKLLKYGKEHRHSREKMREYKKKYSGDFAVNPKWGRAFAGREEYA